MPDSKDDDDYDFPVIRVKRAGDRERGIQNWHYYNKTMDFSQVKLSPMAEAYMKKVENNPADIIHQIGSFALLPETTAFSAGARIGTVGKIQGITAFPGNRARGFDLQMEPIPMRAAASEEVAAPAFVDPSATKSYPLEAAAAAMAPDPGSSAFMMAEEDTSVLEELVRITRGSERETWREALRQTRERQRVEREGTAEDIEMIERPGLRRRMNRERGDTEETTFMEEVAQESNEPRPRGRKGKRPLKTSTPKKGRPKKGRVVSAEDIGGGEYTVQYEKLDTPVFRRGGAELRSGARQYEEIELGNMSDIVIDASLPEETLEETSLTALLPDTIEENVPVRGPRLEMTEVRMGRGVPVANRSGKIVELPWAREARLNTIRRKFRSAPSSLLPWRGGGKRPRPIPIPPRPRPKPKPKPTPIPPKPTPKPKPKPKPIKKRVRFEEDFIITKKRKRKLKVKKKRKSKRKLRRRRK